MTAEGKRRQLRQERHTTDFKKDLPALIFVSGFLQVLFNASPMAFNIGQASPQVVVRLRPIVTSIYDVTIGRPRPDKNRMFCSGVRIVARASTSSVRRRSDVITYLGSAPKEQLTAAEALR